MARTGDTERAPPNDRGAKRRSDYHGNIETYRGGICGRLLALSLRLARESVKRSRDEGLVGHQHRDWRRRQEVFGSAAEDHLA